VLSGAGSSRFYTPNIGFVGIDGFDFTATGNDGMSSCAAMARITANAIGVGKNQPHLASFSYRATNLMAV